MRSSNNDNRQSDDLPVIPIVLIKKLINVMLENIEVRSMVDNVVKLFHVPLEYHCGTHNFTICGTTPRTLFYI